MMCRIGRCLNILLMIVLLALPASAEQYALPEIRRQAEKGWHSVYEACGRTIVVDIPITVPDADSFPALTARLMPYSDAVPKPEDGKWRRVFDGENSVDNGRLSFVFMTGDYFKQESLGCYSEPSDRRSFEPQVFYPPDIDMDRPYAANNVATPRSLVGLVEKVWQRYFPDISVDLRLSSIEAGIAYREFDMTRLQYVGEPTQTDREAFLSATFTQYMHDIPLLVCAEKSYSRFGGLESGRNDYRVVPMLNAYASSRSFRGFDLPHRNESVIFSLLMEGETLAPDLPLCGVETAIAAYERLIEAGQLRLVDSLSLGYAVWFGREADSFILMPAWVAWGVLLRSPDQEAWKQNSDETLAQSNYRMSTQYGPIMVNAQTGELIDPWRTDSERSFDHPDILLWGQ